MLVKELMERTGVSSFGLARMLIEDAMLEMNIAQAPWQKEISISILKDQRFYFLPKEAVKIIDIQVRNNMNSKGEYRSVPRLLNPPADKGSSTSSRISDLNAIKKTVVETSGNHYQANIEDIGSKAMEYGYYIQGDKLAIVEKSLYNDVNADVTNDSNAYQKSDYSWRTPSINNLSGIKIVYAYNPVYSFNRIGRFTNSNYHTQRQVLQVLDKKSDLYAIDSAGAFTTSTQYVMLLAEFGDANPDKSILDYTLTDLTATDMDSLFPVGSLIFVDDLGFFSGIWEITQVAGANHAALAQAKSLLGVRRPLNWGDGYAEMYNGVNGVIDFTNAIQWGRISSVVTQINSLYTDREDFLLPVTEFQARAMICFIKAQLALEQGNVEMKMYYDKEFKRKLAQQETAYVSGPRMISAGPFALK